MRSLRPRVLIVDQDRELLTTVGDLALAEGFEVSSTGDVGHALAQLRHRPAQVVLIDARRSGTNPARLLHAIHEVNPNCRVALMSGEASDSAIAAIASGADDYLCKPLDAQRVRRLLAAVRHTDDTRRAVLRLEAELAQRLEFCGMVGRGPAMQGVFDLIRRLAPHAQVALMTGAAGTGKELAARAFHSLGPRRSHPFVVVDCGAAVESLLERQLFGNAASGVTGPSSQRGALVEAADGGTLFFDHVGELPMSLQDRLLRVIETGTMRRMGASESHPVNLQVIGATEQPLEADVAAGRFKTDLYERLRVAAITLPPLRDRVEDIVYLSALFIRKFAERFEKPLAGPTSGAERLLHGAEWDSNVRQLRHVLERACILADGEFITEADLSAVMPEQLPRAPLAVRHADSTERNTAVIPLAAIERDHIIRTLDRVNGNKAVAARMLGLSRRALYRQLERHGLHTRVPADVRATSTGRAPMVEHR